MSNKKIKKVDGSVDDACRLSLSEQNKIIALYVDKNLSICEISHRTHHKIDTVSKVLKNNEILVPIGLRPYKFTEEEKKTITNIILNHGSYGEAARAVKHDAILIRRYVKEAGLAYDYRKKNRNIDDNFFSIIDTPEKAWLIGFLYTDGSVRNNSHAHYQIRLSIGIKDVDIIKQILNWLNSDSQITYDHRPNKEMAGFEFSNKQIYEDLEKYGIVPNKTYKSMSLAYKLIPDEFKIDYLRGLFDGDGGFAFTDNVHDVSLSFTEYNKNVALEYQHIIDSLIGKTQSNKIIEVDGTDGSHRTHCRWHGSEQVLKILDLLYKDAKVYLPRKYNKYLAFKKQYKI